MLTFGFAFAQYLMMKYQLIYPIAFYVFYMAALGIFNLWIRIQAVKTRQVSPKYFKTYLGDTLPERIQVVERHYDNQFQLPLLFFITIAVHLTIGRADYSTLAMAWAFVASRLIHSWIHLGSNYLPKRAAAFALGWVLIILLWIQLLQVSRPTGCRSWHIYINKNEVDYV